jgi:hypothetical protein
MLDAIITLVNIVDKVLDTYNTNERWLLVASNICNSPYLYIMNAIGQVVRVAIHHIYGAIHYNSIATLLQQLIFNYYAIPL